MDLTKVYNINNKEEARQFGVAFQSWASKQSLSYGELANWTNALETLAKKFGLKREFRENGII